MIKDILLACIPMFVVVDALGTLPIFSALTEQTSVNDKRKIIFQSLITALVLAFGFIMIGKAVFKFLGITMGDFMIAGGAILFCIAIIDMINPGKVRRMPSDQLGAVPIGTPLIVGPAVLTTSLLLIDQYGLVPTLISVSANILFAGLVFSFSDQLMKFFGQAGSKAITKVMALLLAAIAIKMIREGIISILNT